MITNTKAWMDVPVFACLLPDNRAQLCAEIDAYVAHPYGFSRDDFAYILDTFPVLKKKEKKAFGESGQMKLFSESPRELCRKINLNWLAALRLRDVGWFSFDPEKVSELNDVQEKELLFLGNLVASGCEKTYSMVWRSHTVPKEPRRNTENQNKNA